MGTQAIIVLLVCAALSSSCFDGATASSQALASGQEKASGMENLFERALMSNGTDYVNTERQLRQLVKSDSAEIRNAISHGSQGPDPLAGILAEVLLAGADARRDYDDLEELFRNLPEETKRTPLGRPAPAEVSEIITRGYGARPTKFLALRLAKEPDWPTWLAAGVLLYLGEHKDASTTSAILRFAIVTPFPARRRLAREALEKIADPALPAKLAQADRWADARDLPVPIELRGIGGAR